MTENPFLGIVLVVRQATSQSTVVFKYPEVDADGCYGIGSVEFSKFAMPTQWLMNRKLDFEIEQCGRAIAAHSSAVVPGNLNHLRFVSFPCDCEESSHYEDENIPPPSLVTAFNIVFVLDSRKVDDDEADLYWQALATVSRALIVEERRCLFLSEQVVSLGNHEDNSLSALLRKVYDGLSSPARAVSLYVNGSVLTHLSVIPFSQAPDPPGGHQALLLTVKPDVLQEALPVDSASNVRRLIDAADPSKTIKDHMIELGLPMSTIQRISQHLVYWRRAKIMPPLHKRMVLHLNPKTAIVPSQELLSDFRSKFGIAKAGTWFAILHAFSKGKRLSEVKEDLSDEQPGLVTRFTDLCTFLLSNDVLTYSSQYFRYFPPTKRLTPGGVPFQRPKFQNALPHEIRSEFSPIEFEVIYERLKFNPSASELMIKLISEYVKRHRDVLTARVELNEQHRCSSEDFQKYTEALMSGYLDSLLVRYEAD